MKLHQLIRVFESLPGEFQDNQVYVSLKTSEYQEEAPPVVMSLAHVGQAFDILEVVVDCEDNTVIIKGQL